MPAAPPSPPDNHAARLRTLWAYLRAVPRFTRAPRTPLAPAAFARLAAAPAGALPPLHAFRTADGAALRYRRYDAPGAGRTLVLVHGSGCFADQFETLARRIAADGAAEVVTLDMRGHGHSDGARGHAVAAPGQPLADLAAFLGHLRETAPDRPLVLGGHSAGGGLVLAVARGTTRRLIDGCLLLAPYLGVGAPVDRPQFGGWVRVRLARLLGIGAANLLGIHRFDGATVIDFAPAAAAADPRYAAGWSFATLLGFGPGPWATDRRPIPADLPVLILAGDGDECFDTARYPAALAAVAPHAELPRVARGGHFDLLVEPYAATLAADWLRRRIPAVAPGVARGVTRAA